MTLKRKRNSSENRGGLNVRHKVLRSGEQGHRVTGGIALPCMQETDRPLLNVNSFPDNY